MKEPAHPVQIWISVLWLASQEQILEIVKNTFDVQQDAKPEEMRAKNSSGASVILHHLGMG